MSLYDTFCGTTRRVLWKPEYHCQTAGHDVTRTGTASWGLNGSKVGQTAAATRGDAPIILLLLLLLLRCFGLLEGTTAADVDVGARVAIRIRQDAEQDEIPRSSWHARHGYISAAGQRETRRFYNARALLSRGCRRRALDYRPANGAAGARGNPRFSTRPATTERRSRAKRAKRKREKKTAK